MLAFLVRRPLHERWPANRVMDTLGLSQERAWPALTQLRREGLVQLHAGDDGCARFSASPIGRKFWRVLAADRLLRL